MLLLAMIQLSVAMLISALIIFTLYLAFRKPGKLGPEERSLYACGERLEPSKGILFSEGFYWALWKRVFRGAYFTLRERIHTGVLNDWFYYTVLWLMIMVVLLTLIFLWGMS